MARDSCVAGRVAQVAQFVEAGVGDAAAETVGVPAQHGAGRDLYRQPVGVVDGQPVGDVAGALPVRLGRADVPGGRPACGPHVPAVGDVQITGGLKMFGDQRGILLSRCRISLFDRDGQPPMQLGAIGFQLGLVGDGADQRMVEHIFRISR